MTPNPLLIATRNPSKLREFKELLKEVDLLFVSLLDFPEAQVGEEVGETFEEIAACKARDAHQATGLLSLADDSGLEIDALGGAPGIHSHRFLGDGVTDDERNCHILRQMAGLPMQERTARFRCSLAIAVSAGEVYTVSGACEGLIADEPRGANGFGYDPLFLLPDLGKTMAELTSEEKNRLSHRGRAASAAIPLIRSPRSTR